MWEEMYSGEIENIFLKRGKDAGSMKVLINNRKIGMDATKGIYEGGFILILL